MEPAATSTASANGHSSEKGRAIAADQPDKQERVERKNASFRTLFQLPPGEAVLFDCSAALLRTMLHHGRLYFSQQHLCFYSNLFGIKVVETIPVDSILAVEKQSNMFLNPGLKIKVESKEYHFASFFDRDATFKRIVKLWHKEDFDSDEESDAPPQEEGEDYDFGDDELTMVLSKEEDKQGNFLHSKENLQSVVTAEFSCTVVKFFSLFYSDESEFTKKYHDARGDTDMIIQKWSEHPEYGSFRTLTFIAPVHAAIGPNSTRLEETQRYHLQKDRLTIETVAVMFDIPYGDYFRVEARHEVTSVGDKCKLSIHVGVTFTKKTFFEGKIQSGTMKECSKSFDTWIALAKEEVKKNKKGKTTPGKSDVEPVKDTSKRKGISIESYQITLSTNQILFVALFLISIFLLLTVVWLSKRITLLEHQVEALQNKGRP